MIAISELVSLQPPCGEEVRRIAGPQDLVTLRTNIGDGGQVEGFSFIDPICGDQIRVVLLNNQTCQPIGEPICLQPGGSIKTVPGKDGEWKVVGTPPDQANSVPACRVVDNKTPRNGLWPIMTE